MYASVAAENGVKQAGIAAAQKAVKDIARKMASDKMIMLVFQCIGCHQCLPYSVWLVM